MKKCIRFLSILVCVLMPLCVDGATRSAVKKSAIDLGTKVDAAVEMKSSSCSEKYAACMDAGCVIDNDSGGRCQCSNKIKDLNAEFEKLRKKDSQTAALASLGKEIVEMGQYEDELMPDGDDDLDSESFTFSGSIGDKLRAEMHDLCMEKMPECKSQVTLIANLYSQKIKSDCAAYENSLTVKNQEAKDRRADAKKAVRSAALEQYQASNKYDLGQCVLEFTSCMKTEETCGEDWTGCIDSLGYDKMYGADIDKVVIEGENSSVSIAKSTMNVLESKKIICENVTNQCVSVKDKVWTAFLKNAIPDIKSAEMLAESNARTSCLANISNCFINACKDNIDDKNPDSYDFCLTHPESVKTMCKVEIEPCLAATGGSFDKPDNSTLWPSVLAKLAAMRVDSCTTELKECLQSTDRCGKDYSQCIGLDTNIIMRMCPYDKLVGCQKVYGKEKILADDNIYEEVARIVDGIVLNVDNEMLNTCQNKVADAMTKVCGGDSTESCAEYAVSDSLGTTSLRYNICQWSSNAPDTTEGFKYFDCRESVDQISDAELGRVKNAQREDEGVVKPFATVISGVIRWESLQITNDGHIDIEGYIKSLEREKIPEEEKVRIRSELNQIQADINRVTDMIETDQWVSFCVSGRNVPGVTDKFAKNAVRFPKLANTIRQQIATAALQKAKNNYYAKYDELTDRMAQDGVKIYERIARNIGENEKDVAASAAQAACANLAASSAFAKAPVGQNILGKALSWVAIAIATIVATVVTFGVGGAAITSAFAASAAAMAGVEAAAATLTATTTAFLAGTATTAAVASSAAALTAATAASVAAFGAVTAVTATVGAAMVGVGTAMAVGSTALAAYALGDSLAAKQSEDNMKNEAKMAREHAELNIDPGHGEFLAQDWNYQELITTDFDKDTMSCKRCIKSRKCKKSKWSLLRNRYCSSWEKWEEEPRCNDLHF